MKYTLENTINIQYDTINILYDKYFEEYDILDNMINIFWRIQYDKYTLENTIRLKYFI